MTAQITHIKSYIQRRRLFSIKEFNTLSTVAWPLILSSLVSMSVSITDVIMIGQLGTLELAAAAAASDFYSVFYYLAAGVIAAISPMIANARGRRNFRLVKTICFQGFVTSILVGIPAAFFVFHTPWALNFIGVQTTIIEAGAPYAKVMAFTLFPMLALSVMHYFLSATNHTRIILFITAISLPTNIFGNYMFLYGNWGAPKLGLAGAGIASFITATAMFLCLLVYSTRHLTLRRYLVFPVVAQKITQIRREIFRIGLPIGISHFGEMGVFLLATVSMGIFGPEILAAHTITLRMAGVFYAIPIAYAQSAMVRIGYLSGTGDFQKLDQAIKTILLFSATAGFGLLLLTLSIKSMLPGLFINTAQLTTIVTMQASMFLTLLALMQPTIVVGTIGGGILRGFKDTKAPMLYSLSCYWGLGFVGALFLALVLDLGGLGIWIGLVSATALFALLIVNRILKIRVVADDPIIKGLSV